MSLLFREFSISVSQRSSEQYSADIIWFVINSVLLNLLHFVKLFGYYEVHQSHRLCIYFNNTNNGRTSKHSEYDYAKKCQTFLCKCQIAMAIPEICQARNLSSSLRISYKSDFCHQKILQKCSKTMFWRCLNRSRVNKHKWWSYIKTFWVSLC